MGKNNNHVRPNRRNSHRRRRAFRKALKHVIHLDKLAGDTKLAREVLAVMKREPALHLDDVYRALRGDMKLDGLNKKTIAVVPGFIGRVQKMIRW